MKNIVYLIPFLFLISCSTLKEVPVQTIEKIEYRDSTVFIHDTLNIKVPVETVKEIVPQDTVSKIATSLAFSEAKIERGMLHHTLEQKGEIKTVYDTIVTVEYVDRIILNVDNIDFLPKDERFDFEDTIEVPFDAIDGFTLKEGDEEVATINKTFTIRISDQTASEYEVENS